MCTGSILILRKHCRTRFLCALINDYGMKNYVGLLNLCEALLN